VRNFLQTLRLPRPIPWILTVVLVGGCSGTGPSGTGYKKVDGKWAYVISNFAQGTVVNHLNADDESFRVVADGAYAKDKKNVFCELEKIPSADPETFEVIDVLGRISKDKKNVYITTIQVPDADPATFKVLQPPRSYARDAKRIYCGTIQMQVDDPETFEPIQSFSGISTIYDEEKFLHDYGKAYRGVVVTQDHPVVVGLGWARDRKSVYFGPGKVEGADRESFKVEGRYEASDKNRKYWGIRPEK
jgi:hypothetical protein